MRAGRRFAGTGRCSRSRRCCSARRWPSGRSGRCARPAGHPGCLVGVGLPEVVEVLHPQPHTVFLGGAGHCGCGVAVELPNGIHRDADLVDQTPEACRHAWKQQPVGDDADRVADASPGPARRSPARQLPARSPGRLFSSLMLMPAALWCSCSAGGREPDRLPGDQARDEMVGHAQPQVAVKRQWLQQRSRPVVPVEAAVAAADRRDGAG